MNITVINGTEKHGVTYRLKETFLTEFRDEANITEYYLPKDCPNFCVGCLNCTLKGEKTCKDAEYIRKMDESLLKSGFDCNDFSCICVSCYGSNESIA